MLERLALAALPQIQLRPIHKNKATTNPDQELCFAYKKNITLPFPPKERSVKICSAKTQVYHKKMSTFFYGLYRKKSEHGRNIPGFSECIKRIYIKHTRSSKSFSVPTN